MKKKRSLTFVEKMHKFYLAGLKDSPPPNRMKNNMDGIPTIEQRVEQIMGIIKNNRESKGKMIYFVMYDIESNKVRTQIVKYLIKKGCVRVQKSIFIANTDRKVYDEIKNDLKEVQECYENKDSILLIPVSTDEVRAMKLIGENIDFDLVLKNRNTLFF